MEFISSQMHVFVAKTSGLNVKLLNNKLLNAANVGIFPKQLFKK